MSTLPPRTPPRFVPTLTEVVRDGSVPMPERPMAAPSAAPGSPPVAWPRAAAPVPVPAVAEKPATPASGGVSSRHSPGDGVGAPAALAPAPGPELPDGFEEHMVHRVMQRVDVMLEQRLREAIATVVQEQTRSVLPRLREEVESVVRHCVYEAVADELASGTPSTVLR